MSIHTKHNDHELMSLLKQGDQLAFAELYNRHWGTLFLHALKMLQHEDEAKDIVQETFINLWSKASTLTLKSSLTAYLFAAVRHKVLNLIRDKKIRTGYINLFSLYLDAHANDVLEQINEKELSEAIEKTISKLPEKMRVIFELSRKDLLSHREIAAKLGLSEATVSKQVSNALTTLRKDLKKPESLILAILLFSR